MKKKIKTDMETGMIPGFRYQDPPSTLILAYI